MGSSSANVPAYGTGVLGALGALGDLGTLGTFGVLGALRALGALGALGASRPLCLLFGAAKLNVLLVLLEPQNVELLELVGLRDHCAFCSEPQNLPLEPQHVPLELQNVFQEPQNVLVEPRHAFLEPFGAIGALGALGPERASEATYSPSESQNVTLEPRNVVLEPQNVFLEPQGHRVCFWRHRTCFQNRGALGGSCSFATVRRLIRCPKRASGSTERD